MKNIHTVLCTLGFLSLLTVPASALAGESLGTFCFVDGPGNVWVLSAEDVGGGNFAVWGHVNHIPEALVSTTTLNGSATLIDSTTLAVSLTQGLVLGGMAFHTLTIDMTTWSGNGVYTGINPSGATSGQISYTLSQTDCP